MSEKRPFSSTPGFNAFLSNFRLQKAGARPRLSPEQINQQAINEWQNRVSDPIGGGQFQKQWDDTAAERMGGGTQAPAAPAAGAPPAPSIPGSGSFNAKLTPPSTGLLSKPDAPEAAETSATAPQPGASFAAKVTPPNLQRQDNLGEGRKSDPYTPGGSQEFAEGQAAFAASKARVNAGDMKGFSVVSTPKTKTPEQMNAELTPAERAAGAFVGPGTGAPGTAQVDGRRVDFRAGDTSVVEPKPEPALAAGSISAKMVGAAPDLRQPAAGGFAANLAAPAGAPVNVAASNVGTPGSAEAFQANLSDPDPEAVKRRKQGGMAAPATL